MGIIYQVKAALPLRVAGPSIYVHNGHRGLTVYIYSVVGYLATRWYTLLGFSSRMVYRSKDEQENGHSYNYLEAIDTVNN